MRPCGVEPGRRLVEEDDRRVPDQAHRDVQAAAHAARVGCHLPRGRVGQRETREQVIGDLARVLPRCRSWATSTRFSRAGEDFVDGGELSGEADATPARSPVACRRRSPCDGGGARVGA